MKLQKSLAVVIPAYSAKYLDGTLKSFAEQSDRRFTIYVGDDCSPEDIRSIVGNYSDSLSIHYTRFDRNLGRDDLVAQWTRCIHLAGEEDWIWLFSDDDIAGRDCVKRFLESDIPDNVDAVHFNLTIIDGHGNVCRHTTTYPEILDSGQFFNLLYRRRIDARMPEFIFRASALKDKGFVGFDLAWRSDNATVMNLAHPSGILTLAGNDCNVSWRDSGSNISARESQQTRKNGSTIAFFNWVDEFFIRNGIRRPMSVPYYTKTLIFQLEYRGWRNFLSDCRNAAKSSTYVQWYARPLFGIFAVYRLIYRRFE